MTIRREPVVLFADDSADDRELIQYVFQGQAPGLELRFTGDGVRALEALLADATASPSSLPDVVFLDIRMLTGLEVLERLRADPRLAHLVVFVLSSSTEVRDIERAYRAGCAAYVYKSTSFDEYEDTLRRACAFGLRLAQQPAQDQGAGPSGSSAG